MCSKLKGAEYKYSGDCGDLVSSPGVKRNEDKDSHVVWERRR